MPQNADRILTTHVGSLIRPPKLIEFWRAIEDGTPYDEAAFEACVSPTSSQRSRAGQADVGIDIVSDGEFSKGVNWAFYIFKRLSGITVRPATPEESKDPMASMRGGRDVQAFPEFYAEYDAASGLGKRLGNRIVVNGPLQYSAQQVSRDIGNLKAAVAKAKQQHPALAGFLPVVAPASALPGAKLEHYKDEESFMSALADALHQEYKAIVDAGLYVQIDDAFLPYMHGTHAPTDVEYGLSGRWAQLRVDALNQALRGIPEERSRYHICWGSWNGPHAFDVPLKDDLDLLQVRVGHYSSRPPIRATPRRMARVGSGEAAARPGADPRRDLARHQHRRAPGTGGGTHRAPRQDRRARERHWRHRLRLRAKSVSRRVHPSIMWAKLKSLAEGARIATATLWGKQSGGVTRRRFARRFRYLNVIRSVRLSVEAAFFNGSFSAFALC